MAPNGLPSSSSKAFATSLAPLSNPLPAFNCPRPHFSPTPIKPAPQLHPHCIATKGRMRSLSTLLLVSYPLESTLLHAFGLLRPCSWAPPWLPSPSPRASTVGLRRQWQVRMWGDRSRHWSEWGGARAAAGGPDGGRRDGRGGAQAHAPGCRPAQLGHEGVPGERRPGLWGPIPSTLCHSKGLLAKKRMHLRAASGTRSGRRPRRPRASSGAAAGARGTRTPTSPRAAQARSTPLTLWPVPRPQLPCRPNAGRPGEPG